MTININGTTVERVVCNGVDVDTAYMGDVIVFESGNKITVGTDGIVTYGFSDRYPPAFGELSDRVIPGFRDTVRRIVWLSNPGYFTGAELEFSQEFADPPPTKVRVTIGSTSILFTDPYYSAYGVAISIADFNALPKSGTHSIKIEAIA